MLFCRKISLIYVLFGCNMDSSGNVVCHIFLKLDGFVAILFKYSIFVANILKYALNASFKYFVLVQPSLPRSPNI